MDTRALRKGSLDVSARSPVVWAGHDENLWIQETSELSRKARVRAPVLGWTPWGPGCREFGPVRIRGTMQPPKQAVRHGGEA